MKKINKPSPDSSQQALNELLFETIDVVNELVEANRNTGENLPTKTPPYVVFDQWCEDWEVDHLSPALKNLRNRLEASNQSDESTHKVIEEGVDEFEKRFGSLTFDNGGALDFTLWDVVDERVHPKDEVGVVMQDWLRTFATKLVEVTKVEGYKMAVKHLREAYEANAITTIPEAIEWLEDNTKDTIKK